MDKWNIVSPDQVMSLFNLPAHIANSPDHHFYIPLDFETDDYFTNNLRYQCIGFIRPARKYDYISFRFWSLHPEWMYDDPNILDPAWSGRIDIYNSEIDSLIALLKAYAPTLRDLGEKEPLFQLIPHEQYEMFQIKRADLSRRDRLYLCQWEPEINDHNEEAQHKLLALRGRDKKTELRMLLTPKKPDPAFQFHNIWTFGEGWLNLTKRGIEEFCQLLESK